MNVLDPINGVCTFSCEGNTHHRCSGAWYSFARRARVRCGCPCHTEETP